MSAGSDSWAENLKRSLETGRGLVSPFEVMSFRKSLSYVASSLRLRLWMLADVRLFWGPGWTSKKYRSNHV